MPRLSTGREFALSLDPIKSAFTSGSIEQRYFLFLNYRLEIHKPGDLLPLATVAYFTPGGGGPPDGEAETSGFTAGAVLSGESDWTAMEVAEFSTFVTEAPRVQAWLEREFADINTLIETSPVWSSELALGD